MRYTKNHSKEVRRAIVESAAKALRADGLSGVSIAELMKGAGLTHGGFYAHFENRDELVAEAVGVAADQTAQAVFAADLSLEQTKGRYLSVEHRDHPEQGCVLAALGCDAPRQAGLVRRAFARVAKGFLELTAQKVGAGSCELSDEALVQASTMIGAVVLSRMVHDRALSTRILRAAKRPSVMTSAGS